MVDGSTSTRPVGAVLKFGEYQQREEMRFRSRKNGCVYLEETWDGKYYYFAKSHLSTSIWRMSVAGGPEEEIISGPLNHFRDWASARRRIYYATTSTTARRNKYTLWYYDFETACSKELYREEGPVNHWRLTVSPNEEWLAYGQMPMPDSELRLMENFR